MSRKAQPRLLHPLWQDESGDSDISITSTAPSEPRSEYTVDDILLEDERSDGVYYLVKWKDYDLHRATWEPAENLNDDLLHQWEERKRQIASGFRVPFDIRTWESAVAAAERAKKLRKAKRKEKRQELARNKKALERTTKAQTTKAQPTKAQTTKFQPTKAQPTSIVQAARNEPSDEDDIPLLHTLRKKKKKIRESDASSFEPDEDVTLAQAKQSKAKVSVQRSKTAMMEAAETSRLSTSTTARARGNGTKESKVKSRPAQPTAISTNISRGPSAQSSSDSDTPLMLSVLGHTKSLSVDSKSPRVTSRAPATKNFGTAAAGARLEVPGAAKPRPQLTGSDLAGRNTPYSPSDAPNSSRNPISGPSQAEAWLESLTDTSGKPNAANIKRPPPSQAVKPRPDGSTGRIEHSGALQAKAATPRTVGLQESPKAAHRQSVDIGQLPRQTATAQSRRQSVPEVAAAKAHGSASRGPASGPSDGPQVDVVANRPKRKLPVDAPESASKAIRFSGNDTGMPVQQPGAARQLTSSTTGAATVTTLPQPSASSSAPKPSGVPTRNPKAKKSGPANVLDNWAAPPVKKTKPPPSTTLEPDGKNKLYNLSAIHNAQVAGRNGATPEPSQIVLMEPSTRKIIHEPPPAPRRPASPPPTRPTRTAEYQTNSTIPLTCPYWNDNLSCDLATRCPFLHESSREVAPYQLYVQYIENLQGKRIYQKFSNPPGPCRYRWTQRGCFKSVVQCSFAHWTEPEVPKVQNEVPKIRKACYYWPKGKCTKSQEHCGFLHYDCGVVSHPPPRPGVYVNNVQEKLIPPHSPAQVPSNSVHETSKKVRFSPSVDDQLSPASPDDSPPLPARGEDLVAAHMSSLAVDLYLPTSAEPSTQLSVDFYGLNDEAKVAIISYLGKPTSMTIQQMCPRESLKDHVLPLVRATIANGFIVATSERRRLNSLVDVLLRVDSAALVPLAGSSLLILYPLEQAQKEWKFLATAGTEPSQPAPLGFFIFSGIEAPATTHQPAYRPEDGTLEGYLKERLGLVGEDFFKCHEGTVAKVVYLMFNKDNELELEIFTRFFRELGARVYNHLVPGSWKGFCADKEGVVIFHPEVYYYPQIPNLATLLWGRTNFFEMGCCRQEKDGFGRYAFRCKPLFPSGRTVFVTDDVLENYPQKALHIVDDILKANKRKGAAKWRLGGRPGLLNWLLSLAKAHMKENENDNTTRAALWAKTCLLLPYDESRSDPPYTGPDCAVASIPPDDLPEWGELILKSKEDANTFIIEWFSVWACLNVSYCRRFFVVHSGEMSQLAEQYKHLIFQTPERYIEKKKAKT